MDEAERKALLDSISKKMVGEDGEIKKMDLWGQKDLSYRIKGNSKGFYVHMELEANPKNAKGLDKTLKLEEDILRYLIIRL